MIEQLMIDKVKVDKFCTNYIFAHNGCNFDFKFIVHELMRQKELTECEIVGNPQNMKAIVCNRLRFYDSFLIMSKSLKQLADSFRGSFNEE